ncbi:aminoglycoside adenylyltransferase domain-containing protein [Halobacillus karajensis]|uniref:Adenylyltransferase AadA C-terminal domain-containing protein n=1 Tax=Halobacillus karajensis TaxID=195088 RepID=A0A024P0M5_9BACI|nr:aminoglycoside adenylyltransferase domain-containing protein [Halobacillus karajensis]CDQ19366.1 hypothetical protein BN982_01659 [Halobacillus karajensis]CDQ21829.1 hypothetical protein BN983_00023 [Halobacillus karajensis]CDQ27669.1 hypothetical protein BN981_01949 [Halobacillus karajensis]
MYGVPICEVFPVIPKKDYLDSIMNDYKDCLENVLEAPVYCVLNILRVYLYLLEGRICSKDEAGRWAMNSPYASTVGKVLKRRRGEAISFSDEELLAFKEYYQKKVEALN